MLNPPPRNAIDSTIPGDDWGSGQNATGILERLGIAKIDSNGLDDPHGQIVNLFDSFSVRNFIQGNIWHQRWMVDYRGVYPRSTARRAAPFADLFWLPSDHSQDRGRLLSGS